MVILVIFSGVYIQISKTVCYGTLYFTYTCNLNNYKRKRKNIYTEKGDEKAIK